jgi:hypothetical protein
MKPGTEREHLDALKRPSFILPVVRNFHTTFANKCVVSRCPHTFKILHAVINGSFGIEESGFMSVSKIGRRYDLFGWRQAAELTSPAKHARHAAFQPFQQIFQCFQGVVLRRKHLGCHSNPPIFQVL